ncbi:hypothetical protein C0989_001307 [Termitomyces sp. Mn162]|nr:hypothetical protein C0989_001307 [Termitomyces sp. Mn162]
MWGAIKWAACPRLSQLGVRQLSLRTIARPVLTAPSLRSSSRLQSLLVTSRSTRSFSSTFVKRHATSTPEARVLPILAPRSVGMWLMMSSTLVFAIVVVGGVTRLTESGLSITEWRPITGVLPPLSEAEWEAEFDKYKQTPEFKKYVSHLPNTELASQPWSRLNSGATLSDFKFIFFMEWSHRLLGRLLGAAFVGPLVYFGIRRKISRAQFAQLFGLGTLIGAQGALGWYMVQSGLDEALMEEPGAVPRVSQYRLAAHLGMALALYAGMFGTGLGIIKDWKFSRGGKWSGSEAVKKFTRVLEKPRVKMFKRQAWALTGLVLLTALSGMRLLLDTRVLCLLLRYWTSGAFVAGLDAGLVYNEFPLMGGRLMPPADELFSPSYAKSADKSDLWWRNIFENPTTVQFDHRVLATTTYISTLLLWASSCRPALRTVLPPLTRTAMTAAFAMANVQVLLGISTLLYLVPVPLAAAHQAGSVMLLSAMLHVLVTLRKPGHAARLWRQMLARAKQGSTAATGTKQGI